MLYLTTRYYSELANGSAQRLLDRAANSAEAQELLAESYQARGEYENATAKYRKILEQYPNQPGVHYQLRRIILAKGLDKVPVLVIEGYVPPREQIDTARFNSDGSIAIQLYFVQPSWSVEQLRNRSAFHWLDELSFSFW